jgi:hypothetical protein
MIIYELTMSKTEIKPITVEVVDLQAAETVSSAVVTHVPPSGNALTISPTVATPNINLLLGPLAVPGKHFVKVQAVGSAGSKPEVLYDITVRDI